MANNITSIVMDPKLAYPDDSFDDRSESVVQIKRAFQKLLEQQNLDGENIGKSHWNPFRDFIKPGDYVFIKPNLVRHFHLQHGDIKAVIVNPIIIKLTLDHVYNALGHSGKVILGDSSLQSADFIEICRINKFARFIEHYKEKDYKLEIKDLRREASIKKFGKFDYLYGRREVNPVSDFFEVNLNDKSFFKDVKHNYKKFRVADYDAKLMQKAHNLKDNKYLIHKDILNANVIINLPKLKTHKKAGITCAMKNLIGINGHKAYLPHHTFGAKEKGGDEYLKANRFREIESYLMEKSYLISYLKLPKPIIITLYDLVSQTRRFFGWLAKRYGEMDDFCRGNWYGNDTLWRTIADLNRIIYYTNKAGEFSNKQKRIVFTIVDGIVSGDRESPMEPRSRKIGLMASSFSTFALDFALTSMIGFYWKKLPFLYKTYEQEKSGFDEFKLAPIDVENIEIFVNESLMKHGEIRKKYNQEFEPTKGWKEYLEYR